jgi:hypothetical protein
MLVARVFPQPAPTTPVEDSEVVVEAVTTTTSNSLRHTPHNNNFDLLPMVVNSNPGIKVEANHFLFRDRQPWAPAALRLSTLSQEHQTWEDRYTWCSPECHSPMDFLWDPNM